MNRIFCFGELLLRFSPLLHGEWIRQSRMDLYLGGAELNVAQALAGWGQQVSYCTALPDHYLSADLMVVLRDKGIDPSPIRLGGNRIGTYYLPQGADLKHVGVVYDRAGSSFAGLQTGMMDWDQLLEGMHWFHFSAITPALSQELAGVCEEALRAATRKGLKISVDLNYRSRLWQYGRDPVEIMSPLVKYCDLVMGNIWSAQRLLGIPLDEGNTTGRNKEILLGQARTSARAILRAFGRCHDVVNTFRFDEGEGIRYFASLDNPEGQYVSPVYELPTVIDRVGSGDCLMAGLIYGQCNDLDHQACIEFAAAAATGKFLEKGDATKQTVAMVRERMK